MIHRRAIEILHNALVFCPAVVPDTAQGGFLVYSAMKVLGHGKTIEDAVNDARRRGNIPDVANRLPFRADGKTVLIADDPIATVKSRTLADRIVNALNVYNPNERGI